VGFLLCIPASAKRKLLFAAAGVSAIFLLNILRCNALAWLSIHQHQWLNFAHKYVFTALAYLSIFYGWLLYAKTAGGNENAE
jgi:exosortase/archaeosortase family protein